MMLPAIIKSKDEKALIIGPCSAESEQQLLKLAPQIKSMNPDLVRAGLWKPRTRPGGFEGLGERAVEWMNMLQSDFGFKICTEVANVQHVEIALKAGFDALWIGARTTVNPFYVSEIANSLKGVDVPVLVKNPMNPDLFLWLGAIERFLDSGLKRLAAIHRGFSFYGNSVYRNIPRWQIPIELKRRMPELQLLVDISHIGGHPHYLLEIAQIAMDLNYDGIMAEVHPNPENAWSDAGQQVSPDYFKRHILDKIILRKKASSSPLFNEQIALLRRQIDQIDLQVLDLLAKRMKLTEVIADHKKIENVSIFQPERWDVIIEQLLQQGKTQDLSEEFIFALTEAIHIESIQHQSRKMNHSIPEKERQ